MDKAQVVIKLVTISPIPRHGGQAAPCRNLSVNNVGTRNVDIGMQCSGHRTLQNLRALNSPKPAWLIACLYLTLASAQSSNGNDILGLYEGLSKILSTAAGSNDFLAVVSAAGRSADAGGNPLSRPLLNQSVIGLICFAITAIRKCNGACPASRLASMACDFRARRTASTRDPAERRRIH